MGDEKMSVSYRVQTEVTPICPGPVPSCPGLNCGVRLLARIDSRVARLGLKAIGGPENDEEEEEEEKKKKPEEDEEEEENDGEEEEVPWQVLGAKKNGPSIKARPASGGRLMF